MTTGTIKGAEVGFAHSGHVHFTFSIEYFELCEHDSEIEEGSAEFKNIYWSPPPLHVTNKCCLPSPPCHPSACGLSAKAH